MSIPCDPEEVILDHNGCAAIQESLLNLTKHKNMAKNQLAICSAVCSSQCRLPSREVGSRQRNPSSIK
jgi:hypothetical protein